MIPSLFFIKKAVVRFSSHLHIILGRNTFLMAISNIYLECKEDLT